MPASFDPQLFVPLVLMGGLGFLLVQLGVRMGALETRPRRCPACGRPGEEVGRCPCSR